MKEKNKTTEFSCHPKALYISFIFVEYIKIDLCFPLVFPMEKKFLLRFCNCICCHFEWAWWVCLWFAQFVWCFFRSVFSVHIRIDRIIIHLIEMESCFYWAMAHVTMNALNCLDIERKQLNAAADVIIVRNQLLKCCSVLIVKNCRISHRRFTLCLPRSV